MFARIVSLDSKPDTHQQFSEFFVLPILHKQQGFKDAMLLVDPGHRKWSRSVCGTRKKTWTLITGRPTRKPQRV
jgi:hypothetical protein